MDETFISLSCANCGAKLSVYDDVQRFVCSYCGTEMIVQRRGGTVVLKAVTEAIKKIQIGTDKTAAELALVRLAGDLKTLRNEYTALLDRINNKNGFWIYLAISCGILCLTFLILGIASARAVTVLLGIFLAGLTVACIAKVRPRSDQDQLHELDKKIADVKTQIADNRKIVESSGQERC